MRPAAGHLHGRPDIVRWGSVPPNAGSAHNVGADQGDVPVIVASWFGGLLTTWRFVHMKSWPLIALGLLTIAEVAGSATWQVTHGPGNPVDMIGSVVAQAGAGDTILVGPGTYNEHITLRDQGITIIGTSGSGATTLDGSAIIAGRPGSVFYAPSQANTRLTLRGFTLRGGTGSSVGSWGRGGGAIAFRGGEYLELADCTFEGNVVSPLPPQGSGGACFIYATSGVITECTFRNNQAGVWGGDLYLAFGEHFLKNCRFEVNDWGAGNGGAVYADFPVSRLRVEECVVLGASSAEANESFYLMALRVELVRNRFLDSHGPSATCLLLCDSGFDPPVSQILLDGNLFVGSAGYGAQHPLAMIYSNATVAVEHNTFLNCSQGFSINNGGALSYRLNVVAQSSVWMRVASGGAIECNDIWPDSSAIVINNGVFSYEGNISGDPQFCDPAGGNYGIAEQSPCAAGNAPLGCDVIGAFGVACEQTPVEKMTWGRMKALFK
jgi:hypothetical protein